MRWQWICALVLAAVPAPAENVVTTPMEGRHLQQLLVIQRVYVDRLSGGETASQMRDMLISSLQNARLFVITENQDRADAFCAARARTWCSRRRTAPRRASRPALTSARRGPRAAASTAASASARASRRTPPSGVTKR